MNETSAIQPAQWARAQLAAAGLTLNHEATQAAQALAAAGVGINPSQLRGLVNALGAGPNRRQPAERRRELARYLAWRASRAKSHAGWDRLAEPLKQHILALEGRCREMVAEIRAADAGYWATYPTALQEEQVRLEIQVLETFVHALAREAADKSPREA